jgi:hypothetical protein
MAPAKSASTADGPALKRYGSMMTFSPNAFRKAPVDIPIIACAWVRFGK